ncbi:MAG: hypothetical protein M1330_00010 [Armatimonadetes bacterium]|nr:hypothetical protein [Armatimonadota bacterium]
MICPRCGTRYRSDEATECPTCCIPLADWDEIEAIPSPGKPMDSAAKNSSTTVVNSSGRSSQVPTVLETMPPTDIALGCTVRAFRIGCLLFPILFLWIVYREVAPRPNPLHFYQVSQFNPPADALADELLPNVVGDYSLRGVGSNPYPNRSQAREFDGVMLPGVALEGHYAHIAAEERQSLNFYVAPVKDPDRVDNFFDRVLVRMRRLHAHSIQFHNNSGPITHRQFLTADLSGRDIAIWRTDRWLFAVDATTRTARNQFARNLSQQ